jgi:hypothetical protein
MTDISKARQRLRDLARLPVESTRTINFKGMEEPVDYTFVVGMLGEVAGPLFMAVQAALTVAEELRVESRQQPVIRNDDKDLAAKAEAADRIEAAILKALS